jgi:hypothetical protein
METDYIQRTKSNDYYQKYSRWTIQQNLEQNNEKFQRYDPKYSKYFLIKPPISNANPYQNQNQNQDLSQNQNQNQDISQNQNQSQGLLDNDSDDDYDDDMGNDYEEEL